MADDKEKKKGVVGNYNQQPVTRRKYYYDYNEVSDTEKGFNDAFTDLAAFNDKLKDELKKEKNVKFQISNLGEGLLKKAKFWSDMSVARREFEDYKEVGGKKDFAEFLKACADCAKKGDAPRSGKDMAKKENKKPKE